MQKSHSAKWNTVKNKSKRRPTCEFEITLFFSLILVHHIRIMNIICIYMQQKIPSDADHNYSAIFCNDFLASNFTILLSINNTSKGIMQQYINIHFLQWIFPSCPLEVYYYYSFYLDFIKQDLINSSRSYLSNICQIICQISDEVCFFCSSKDSLHLQTMKKEEREKNLQKAKNESGYDVLNIF